MDLDRGDGGGGGIAGLEPLERDQQCWTHWIKRWPPARPRPRPPVHDRRTPPRRLPAYLSRHMGLRVSLVRRPFDLAGAILRLILPRDLASLDLSPSTPRSDPLGTRMLHYNGLRVLLVVLGCWAVLSHAGFSCLLYVSPLRKGCASGSGPACCCSLRPEGL
jgi:hypothetical protein